MITLNINHSLTSRQAEALLKAVIIYANKNNWTNRHCNHGTSIILAPEFLGIEEPWKIAQASLKEAGLAFRVIEIEEIKETHLLTEAAL